MVKEQEEESVAGMKGQREDRWELGQSREAAARPRGGKRLGVKTGEMWVALCGWNGDGSRRGAASLRSEEGPSPGPGGAASARPPVVPRPPVAARISLAFKGSCARLCRQPVPCARAGPGLLFIVEPDCLAQGTKRARGKCFLPEGTHVHE